MDETTDYPGDPVGVLLTIAHEVPCSGEVVMAAIQAAGLRALLPSMTTRIDHVSNALYKVLQSPTEEEERDIKGTIRSWVRSGQIPDINYSWASRDIAVWLLAEEY